jgi:hypothetical protein
VRIQLKPSNQTIKKSPKSIPLIGLFLQIVFCIITFITIREGAPSPFGLSDAAFHGVGYFLLITVIGLIFGIIALKKNSRYDPSAGLYRLLGYFIAVWPLMIIFIFIIMVNLK